MRTDGQNDGLSNLRMCSCSTRNLVLHVGMSIYLIRNQGVILLVSCTKVYQRDHRLTEVWPAI